MFEQLKKTSSSGLKKNFDPSLERSRYELMVQKINSRGAIGRPVYIYLFGENKEWNSTDNLKIFGKVRVW
jgi:hypothetical protein